jgi:GT2 family glycosyltransferase
MSSLPVLGVTVVTFNAADVILDCLATLLAAGAGVDLRVVVVDNASTDGTPGLIEDWAAGRRPWAPPADLPFAAPPLAPPPVLHHAPPGLPAASAPLLTLVRAGVNGGFAAGVNIGLKHLFADPAIPRVWVLNPDSVVPPGTPLAFATHDPGPFALMGGRVTYYDRPDTIQIDGGTINRRTGVTGNLNLGRDIREVPAPPPEAMDFVTGASMVASRAF